jgi:hypothetical protein
MKRSVLLAIIFLWPACSLYGQSNKTLNIAVIADKTAGLDKSPLVSLLEVQLSNNKNIKLLERAQIDKIMQEQQLSASGLLERTNAIKIGQLLRADAFVIITPENQTGQAGDLIRVRVAQAAHGLRLLDYFEQIDASKPDDTAQKISKRIDSVITKLSLPAGQAIPVGIVDIHRVQLGDRYKILERSLPVLLSVRLGIEPKLIMLEREDLKVLMDEKLRTAGEDSKFWGSAVLIEGNLQPKNGGLEMTLALRKPDGKEIKTVIVPVEPNEPSVAIDKASTDIVHAILNAPPASQWDLAAEAEQFYQQGQMLFNHSRYEEAVPIFETAHTLQPQNIYYTGTLFETVWEIRRKIELAVLRNESNLKSREELEKKNPTVTITPLKLEEIGICPYSDIDIVEIVSTLVRQIRNGYEKGLFSARDIYNNWSNSLGADLMRSGYLASNVSVSTEQIRVINRDNRKIWIETFDSALQKQLLRNDNPPMNNLIRARLVWISSDDPNELMVNLKKVFTEFVMPFELGGRIRSDSERKHIYEQAFTLNSPIFSLGYFDHYTSLKYSGDIIYLWWEYIQGFVDVKDSVLSDIGKLALTQVSSGASNQTESTQAQSDGLKTIEELEAKLTNPNDNLDNKTKQQLIISIKGLLETRPIISINNQRLLIWEKIYEFLIKQKDIDSLIEIGAYFPSLVGDYNFQKETELRHYQLLEQIVEILQVHKGENQVSEVLSKIKNTQAIIRNKFPELNLQQAVSSLPVTMLLTKKDLLQNMQNNINNSTRVFGVILKDRVLWTTLILYGRGYSDSEGNVQWPSIIAVGGYNLLKKELTTLWQIETSFSQPPSLGTLVFGSKASYLFINRVGIVELPSILAEEKKILHNPRVLTQKNNLPSLSITSVAQDNDKIWVAYGGVKEESGIGLYDPKTEKWETVFCSTLKNKSPFSVGQPYQINSMICLQPNKLLFSVSGIEQSGLWRMDTNTQELKYLGSAQGSFIQDLESNNLWLTSSSYWIEIIPDSEKITLILRDALTKLRMSPQKNKLVAGLNEDMFLPESFLNDVVFGLYGALSSIDLSTSAIHGDKLWARFGKNQIVIAEKGKSFKEAQIIDNDILDGGPVSRFVSTPYGLIAIGAGTVGLIETQ